VGVTGVELAPDLRSTAFRNYVLFFRYAEDRLAIIDILEGHRDIPDYFYTADPE
jgi:plasmid stabilization system protein ParE